MSCIVSCWFLLLTVPCRVNHLVLIEGSNLSSYFLYKVSLGQNHNEFLHFQHFNVTCSNCAYCSEFWALSHNLSSRQLSPYCCYFSFWERRRQMLYGDWPWVSNAVCFFFWADRDSPCINPLILFSLSCQLYPPFSRKEQSYCSFFYAHFYFCADFDSISKPQALSLETFEWCHLVWDWWSVWQSSNSTALSHTFVGSYKNACLVYPLSSDSSCFWVPLYLCSCSKHWAYSFVKDAMFWVWTLCA